MNSLDRRDFLKMLGGGLIIFISPELSEAQYRSRRQDADGRMRDDGVGLCSL